jgi:hypothetical protein
VWQVEHNRDHFDSNSNVYNHYDDIASNVDTYFDLKFYRVYNNYHQFDRKLVG